MTIMIQTRNHVPVQTDNLKDIVFEFNEKKSRANRSSFSIWCFTEVS